MTVMSELSQSQEDDSEDAYVYFDEQVEVKYSNKIKYGNMIKRICISSYIKQ